MRDEREAGVTTSNPEHRMTDDELLQVAGLVMDEDDPLPIAAVPFACGALTWAKVDGELAELLHDSSLAEVVMRADGASRLLVFQAGDVTLDVEHSSGDVE